MAPTQCTAGQRRSGTDAQALTSLMSSAYSTSCWSKLQFEVFSEFWTPYDVTARQDCKLEVSSWLQVVLREAGEGRRVVLASLRDYGSARLQLEMTSWVQVGDWRGTHYTAQPTNNY